ncbi:MAG: RnfABCDGE type electron transport complex subunit D [Oscillospiraceae bacterium]|nr:RnfABCDGE type electron transport complex subunit D [Oscillospiraceae bacterium]
MFFKASKSQKTDLLLTLLAVLAMSIYLYGFRVLFMTAFTVVIALVFEYLCMCLLGKKKGERVSLETVLTAVIFTFCLSAATPYWVSVYGMLMAIVVAKFPFGGTGKNIFNPAAAGLAFSAVSFPALLFQYPAPYTQVPWFDPVTAPMQASPGAVLQAGGSPAINTMNTLLSSYSGPIGATAIFVLAACALYLVLRKTAAWRIILSAGLSLSAVAFLFPRTSADGFHSVVYELVSGIFLFAIVFMASDPVTSPKSGWGQVLYGMMIGFGTMLVRYLAESEVSVVFPLLAANALAPFFDRVGLKIVSHFAQVRAAQKGADGEKREESVPGVTAGE